MKQLLIKRNIVLLAVVAAAFAVTAPFGLQHVSARDGADDTVTQMTTTPQTETEKPDDSVTNKTELERHVSDLKIAGQREVERERQKKNRETMKEEKRKLVCENKQNAINHKLAAFTQAADRHLARLDDTFAKVQVYQTANNLPVANYDELVAAATDKKQAAVDAVAVLKVVAVGVDCADPTTVLKLSTVREAAKAAKQALHEYRMAIKEIVVALVQAKDDSAGDDNSTEGADTSTSTSTEGNQ